MTNVEAFIVECRMCGTERPDSDFYAAPGGRLKHPCRPCGRAYALERLKPDPVCYLEGCDRLAMSRGLCDPHNDAAMGRSTYQDNDTYTGRGVDLCAVCGIPTRNRPHRIGQPCPVWVAATAIS